MQQNDSLADRPGAHEGWTTTDPWTPERGERGLSRGYSAWFREREKNAAVAALCSARCGAHTQAAALGSGRGGLGTSLLDSEAGRGSVQASGEPRQEGWLFDDGHVKVWAVRKVWAVITAAGALELWTHPPSDEGRKRLVEASLHGCIVHELPAKAAGSAQDSSAWTWIRAKLAAAPEEAEPVEQTQSGALAVSRGFSVALAAAPPHTDGCTRWEFRADGEDQRWINTLVGASGSHPGRGLAVGVTAILLRPPLHIIGVSMRMERGRQQNDSLANG